MAADITDDSSQDTLGSAFGELSSSSGDFETKLDRLKTAVAELEESTEKLCAQKEAESDSLSRLADTLSGQATEDTSASAADVSVVADD